MARSFWKTPFFVKNLNYNNKNLIIKRKILLLYYLVGKLLKVYTGNKYEYLEVEIELLNNKIGEFVLSKTFAFHPAKKLANIKKKKKQINE